MHFVSFICAECRESIIYKSILFALNLLFINSSSIFAIPMIPKGYFEDLIAHSSRFRGILVILGCFSRFRDFKAII